MSIKVLYFASLRDRVGRAEDTLEISSPVSVVELWQQANPALAMNDAMLTAINMEYVGLDAKVNDGDEVAFFPPVTGG